MNSKIISNKVAKRSVVGTLAAPKIALVIWLISCAFGQARAEDAFVVDVVRSKPYDRVSISAAIKGAFSREIVETIGSGAPVTFTYFLQLKKYRPVVWNETVRSLAIKRMVKFDTLRKEYLTWEKRAEDEDDINFKAELAAMEYKVAEGDKKEQNPQAPGGGDDPQMDEAMIKPVAIKDIKELEHWMTHLEKIDLGAVEGLKQHQRYYARVRCEMKSIKLIPPFNYILFFLSFWDFDTDWGSSTPFTINGEALDKGKEDNTGG